MEDTLHLNNDWRKIAASAYKKPIDGKIFGSVSLDITDLEAYITEKRKQGLKATLTHIIVLAVARAIRTNVPELNTYVLRGRIRQREHIDATVTVLLKDQVMGSIRVPDADQLKLVELVELFQAEVVRSRRGHENKTMHNKALLARIPWPFRGWIFHLLRKISMNWGISIPALGLSHNAFGSFLVSNIGSVGLDIGYPALFPVSNVPIVVNMGGVEKKPVVVDNQVVIRRILTMSAAMDHRVVDAYHAGALFKAVRELIRHPEELEARPE